MSHESLCRALCIPRSEQNPQTIDKMYQKRARLGYLLWIIYIGLICHLTKAFATTMWFYLYNTLYCITNTYMNSCFTLVVIYRLCFTLFLYHFVLMSINGGRSRVTNFINDFAWPIKIIIFIQIFFVCCLIYNSAFELIAQIYLWAAMVLVPFKLILLNDALFFYFNKGRHTRIAGFSKVWNIFAYSFGLVCLVLGLGLFAFCFYWYNYLCTDYKVITSVIFVLSALIVIMNSIRYKLKPETNYIFVFFLLCSLVSYGIVAATPYTTCVNTLNRNFVYSFSSMHIDTAFGGITRVGDLCVRTILSGE
jgi:hypothetical protein